MRPFAIWAVACVVTTAGLTGVHAQGTGDKLTNDKIIRAMNEVQSELQTCLVYYTVVKQCLGDRDAALSKATQATVDHLTNFSIQMGQSIGLTNDAMLSRIQMMTKEQMGLINGNCINIASLYQRHAMRCKQVVENGDSILAEHLKK
jgi:hypothetical protein